MAHILLFSKVLPGWSWQPASSSAHDDASSLSIFEDTTFGNNDLQPNVRSRVVFLPDYDIAIAQELVQGVDLWLNTLRRPWEACGTIGMKVLVNGGLNLSELDGWWAEAHAPEMG